MSQSKPIRPGLVSISFRKLDPTEIVSLCQRAGLEGIEWGGDVHVPHGDAQRAREVRQITEDAGLSVACYGSYYGRGPAEGVSFDAMLETALALGAPSIRVWAGKGSAESTDSDRHAAEDDLRKIAEQAKAVGLRVCAEKHEGTLTDTDESTKRLLEAVPSPAFTSLWQPPHGKTLEENLASLEISLPRLENLHVFHWWASPKERRPLAEGIECWQAYIDRARNAADWALLEFFQGDSVEQFMADAETLHRLLDGKSG